MSNETFNNSIRYIKVNWMRLCIMDVLKQGTNMPVRSFTDKFILIVLCVHGQMNRLSSSAAVLSRACAYGSLARNGTDGC